MALAYTDLGQLAYESYCESAGWHSLTTGEALPQWEALSPKIQQGWICAGKSVRNALRIPQIGEYVIITTRNGDGTYTTIPALVSQVHSPISINVIAVDKNAANADDLGYTIDRTRTEIPVKNSADAETVTYWEYPVQNDHDVIGA